MCKRGIEKPATAQAFVENEKEKNLLLLRLFRKDE